MTPRCVRLSSIKCIGPLTALCILVSISLGSEPSHTVDHEIPRIQHLTFEPGHPPPILTRAPGVEAAFCGTVFECFVRFDASTPLFTAGLGAAKIKAVGVTTRLRITIWTPEGGPPEYMAHEETHRAISEHYYERAGEIAERLAKKIAGSRLALPKRKNQAMFKAALRQTEDEFLAEYMGQTNERCEFAQDQFDTITDHGREPITNEDAMRQAIAAEERHWATQAKSQ
jgi:hypothetical protein